MSKTGIYIPHQDASWELEHTACAEFLRGHNRCEAKDCDCQHGCSHAVAGTRWEIILRKYCASQGIHIKCGNLDRTKPEWECGECTLMIQRAPGGATRATFKRRNHHLVLNFLHPAVWLVHFLSSTVFTPKSSNAQGWTFYKHATLRVWF